MNRLSKSSLMYIFYDFHVGSVNVTTYSRLGNASIWDTCHKYLVI